MKNYYRVMLGKKSVHAQQCFDENFIGADFGITEDLTQKLPEAWQAFNKAFIPVYLAANPGKSKIAAGLACGFLWTIAKGISNGDYVLCPDGSGAYRVGEVAGGYQYSPGGVLPHRRPVQWHNQLIDRSAMSDALKHSAGSIGTVSDISGYREELEKLLGIGAIPMVVSTDASVEDPINFALEKHLEDFLVENWQQTELGKEYCIYEDEGEQVGQQYQTDTGNIDILAISKDKKKLLVVELKKGRASDAVVGQVLRYMGYVQQELAEPGQVVVGAVIALEDDLKLRRALSMVPCAHFYRYKVDFTLLKS